MKTKCFAIASVVVCSLACFLLLAGAGQAQAESFSYDFEGLTAGSIAGQDGWANANGWSDCQVTTGTGANTTNVASNSANTAGDTRAIQTMYFTSANTAAEQRLWVYTNDAANGGATGGAIFSGDAGDGKTGVFGIAWSGSQSGFRKDGGAWTVGDILTSGRWYEMKLVMDFSVAGGSATMYHRDVTAGATSFTQDGTVVNVNMGLTADGLGRYAATGIKLRVDTDATSAYTSAVDNFSLSTSTVPEPSSLVLLGAGLLGLVAYAWRKRR